MAVAHLGAILITYRQDEVEYIPDDSNAKLAFLQMNSAMLIILSSPTRRNI